jgi:hypothetical protein
LSVGSANSWRASEPNVPSSSGCPRPPQTETLVTKQAYGRLAALFCVVAKKQVTRVRRLPACFDPAGGDFFASDRKTPFFVGSVRDRALVARFPRGDARTANLDLVTDVTESSLIDVETGDSSGAAVGGFYRAGPQVPSVARYAEMS